MTKGNAVKKDVITCVWTLFIKVLHMFGTYLLKYYMCLDHVYWSITYVWILFIKVLHMLGTCLLKYYMCLEPVY
jgi:hypothetical protein